jgi:probable phosphoglycerate mutase
MIVALLRHGLTAWNDAGRMQGRADVPLCESGRSQVRGWRLPLALAHARFCTSPLDRARETASLLGAQEPVIVPALTEMDWGEWEGATLAELRARHGAAFDEIAARGADFRAPGGESPREVSMRLAAWLEAIAGEPVAIVAVTHKGVIHAALALATGWDMIGKPPVRLADDVVHMLDVDAGGRIRDAHWNVPLTDGPLARRRPRPPTSVPL